MIRVIVGLAVLAPILIGCSGKRPSAPPQLQVFIASKEQKDGLHEAKFSAYPGLGYIAAKPDLTISRLESVTFGAPRIVPGGRAGKEPLKEDRHMLVLRLTSEDAKALQDLTAAHLGDRLLMLLGDEPLFAPELRTPSIGQQVYITPPAGADTPKLKAKLETLVQAPK